MIIYPAIDLLDGKVVRLHKGRFEEQTIYSHDPLSMAKSFEDAGAKFLHMVDLNGARRQDRQLDVIEKIVSQTSLKVQVGGGIKSEKDLSELLSLGADRVVFGSMAVKDPCFINLMIDKYGSDNITVALDVEKDTHSHHYDVKTHGWSESSRTSLEVAFSKFNWKSRLQFLVTDISKDGTLQGVNNSLYRFVLEKFPEAKVLVSGGVAGLSDIELARKINAVGIIVGKAIYENTISLQDLLLERGETLC